MARSAAVVAAAALLVLLVGVPPALAAGGAVPTFPDAFARSRIVVVATVETAPPADARFSLSVERTLKGEAGPRLDFPAEATSIDLAAGVRVVLLAMDPRSLDFRGTTALLVAPDGTIDPDGLAEVPPTLDALVAEYGAGLVAAGGGTRAPDASSSGGGGSAKGTGTGAGTADDTTTPHASAAPGGGGPGGSAPVGPVLLIVAVGVAGVLLAVAARRAT